jgi:hypothetical protein
MSSKRHLRRTKCERKVRFLSQGEAGIRAAQIYRHGGDLMKPYQCRHCHRWHLGHEPGTRQEHRSAVLAIVF